MDYYLGIDGGGTKTVCLVGDAHGHLVGYGRGGPANTNFISAEGARQSIFEAVRNAWRASGPPAVSPRMAIVTGPIPLEMVREAVSREAMSDQVSHASEGEGAWQAALAWREHDFGVTVGAGTGAVIAGTNRAGEHAVASAWGALLGDEGSGYWIALEAMRAIVRAEDGREPPTRLRQAIAGELKIDSLWELVALLHQKGMSRREIAAFCPLVVQVARGGDPKACAILAAAGAELALAATAVIRRLGIGAEEFAVVPFGSVFKAGELLFGPFRERVLQAAPRAKFVFLRYEPVVGALLLAWQRAGVALDDGLMANLDEDLHESSFPGGLNSQLVRETNPE
jgi:N-acetylglucosamine kinase-like BadF-type ATPase